MQYVDSVMCSDQPRGVDRVQALVEATRQLVEEGL
jgi:hypothetical protein